MSNEHKNAVFERVTFGFWVYLMSDCVLFAGLFATFAILRNATFGGASIGQIVDLNYVLIETLVLLTSSFTVGVALLASESRRKNLTLWALLATLALGLFFLSMEFWEFAHLVGEGNGPARSAFLSSFFTLLGTHGLHVFLGAIWMLVLMGHVFFKGITDGSMRKLACLALFWHFLDIIWIFIFTIVYLFGIAL